MRTEKPQCTDMADKALDCIDAQTTPELLPCPFCGDAPATGPANPETEGDAWTWLACANADCDVRPEVAIYADNTHRAEAIAAWNRRSPTPQQGLEAAVERMREAIGSAISTRERDATDEYAKGFNNGLRAAEVIVLEVLSTDAELHMGGAGAALVISEPMPRDDASDGLAGVLAEARGGIQAFYDMVRVMQRVQALPIPAILERAEYNCPVLLANIDAHLAALSQHKPSGGANASDEGEGA